MYAWTVVVSILALVARLDELVTQPSSLWIRGIRDIDTHPPTPITTEDIITLAKRHHYFDH